MDSIDSNLLRIKKALEKRRFSAMTIKSQVLLPDRGSRIGTRSSSQTSFEISDAVDPQAVNMKADFDGSGMAKESGPRLLIMIKRTIKKLWF